MSSGSHREWIQDEIRRRAAYHKSQKHLIVDYYRIRRRVAYPLPVTGLNIPTIPIPDIPAYPWATWMTWALEERVNALGWATQWFGDQEARETVECDLLHLAQWPEYQQYPSPDLSLGHAARILANSYRQWSWLSPEVRNAIQAAMQRIVAQSGPLVEERLQPYDSVEDILTANEPHIVVANIPTIGALGVALAANAVNLPEKQTLNVTIKKVLLAMLAQRENGFSEGVAYNGYVLDFVLDWLPFLTDEERAVFFNHSELGHYLDESLWMGVPGDAVFVAELGDVEAQQMPFHISAQAKMWKFDPLPERAWYLLQCRLAWLRADGLAALNELPEGVAVVEPKAPAAKDAHCAVVLRSGWASDDVAVVAASSNSSMGHVPANYGSLCIGSVGQWLIQTPGYQQYVKTSEREFTIGKVSRNTPVIDGCSVTQKAGRLLHLGENEGYATASFDLSDCYAFEKGSRFVTRSVTLSTQSHPSLILVEDHFGGVVQEKLEYFWHGHPEAAWWAQDGWAMLTLNGCTLWFTSPQFVIDGTCIQRLRGSRGQLTLVNNFTTSLDKNLKPPEMVHWLFTFQDECPGSVEPIIQRLKNLKEVGDS